MIRTTRHITLVRPDIRVLSCSATWKRGFSDVSPSSVVLLLYPLTGDECMRNEKGICRRHAPHGKLPRQLDDGEFLTCCFIYKNFDPRNTEKLRCLPSMDCYNNWRIQTRRKGLPPALHRQQALLKAGRLRVGSIYPAFGVTSRLVQRAKHLLCNGIFRLSQPFRSCSKVARRGPWALVQPVEVLHHQGAEAGGFQIHAPNRGILQQGAESPPGWPASQRGWPGRWAAPFPAGGSGEQVKGWPWSSTGFQVPQPARQHQGHPLQLAGGAPLQVEAYIHPKADGQLLGGVRGDALGGVSGMKGLGESAGSAPPPKRPWAR